MNYKCAVILAAGEGTRMKSSKPKAMAEVLFKPMIDWVISAAKKGGAEEVCVVTGYKSEILKDHLDGSIETVLQQERLGTGHAVMQARDFIKAHTPGNVLVLNGDAPLMDADTISGALDFHCETGNTATVISAKVANPFGYGRIERNEKGLLKAIVEEKEANDTQKQINEVNSGAFWFDSSALLKALDILASSHDKSKEYYLTDAIEIILSNGGKAAAYVSKTPDVVLGANDRAQLYELNEIARKSVLTKIMKSGVSIPCIDGVMIDPEAEIGVDTQILPGTIIKGKTVVGSGCLIGPNSIVDNSKIEDDVELKNANIGDETKISHLTYIGDADFGKNINVGCGCATVNFNGREKNRTVVGDNAFIGCSTYLVAPVKVGDNAYTAAGSVITEDVPKDSLALARSRQTIKKGWVTSKKPYKWQK